MTDHERPLNERGQRDAPRIGRLISDLGLQPDLILCSTAARAQATGQQVIQGGGWAIAPHLITELYLAPAETYLDVLRQQSDQFSRILVIGHNPGLEDLVHVLTGSHIALPTAALVQVDFEFTSWRAISSDSGQLIGNWTPRELD